MTLRISRSLIIPAAAILGVVTVAPPHQPTALVTYLRVGDARIVFESDTILEFGKPVALEASTFSTVAKSLAPATVGTKGDAGEVLNWVCYRLRGAVAMSLLLESGEMGGGDLVEGFDIAPAGSQPALERDCAPLNIDAQTLMTDRGIRLGLTRREVSKRLGVSGRDSAGTVLFEKTLDKVSRAPDGRRQAYTESAWFRIRFRANRAVEIAG